MTDSEEKLYALVDAHNTVCIGLMQIGAIAVCGISHRDDSVDRDPEDQLNNLVLLLQTIKGLIGPLRDELETNYPCDVLSETSPESKAKVTSIDQS